MWQEVIVAYFEILYRYLPRMTEAKPSVVSRLLLAEPGFEHGCLAYEAGQDRPVSLFGLFTSSFPSPRVYTHRFVAHAHVMLVSIVWL
jgi:hypothetical protein